MFKKSVLYTLLVLFCVGNVYALGNQNPPPSRLILLCLRPANIEEGLRTLRAKYPNLRPEQADEYPNTLYYILAGSGVMDETRKDEKSKPKKQYIEVIKQEDWTTLVDVPDEIVEKGKKAENMSSHDWFYKFTWVNRAADSSDPSDWEACPTTHRSAR